MIKKILLTITFIFIFAQATFTQEIFRVTSVNFDTSHSLIFLTSPDNTTEAILKNVKLTKLQNPKRVYFDIDSAVLTAPPQNWYFNSGALKQVKIGQFSTNPNKIRAVLYLNEDFDQSKITFLKVNNNIAIKYSNGVGKEEYFQNTYRDEKASSSDFYEKLSISSEEIEKIKPVANVPQSAQPANQQGDVLLNQIQQAFNSSTPSAAIKPAAVKSSDAIKKELKLKSKYYLNLITPNSTGTNATGFLVSGFGVVGLEKPMYLTNPARVVYDIPNAVVNPAVKNQEFKIGADTVKVGQFESNKVRIVVTSNQLEKYFPIFSSDGQSVLFMNTDAVDATSLFSKTTDATSYYIKQLNPLSDEFIITFNSPVVHSIRRDSEKLTMNFYNALRYNDLTFKNSIKDTDLSDMKIDLLPKVGLKMELPLEKDSVVSSYLGSDGKTIKIIIKGVKHKKIAPCPVDKTAAAVLPRCNGKKVVVIDAGHGGSDYGALRAGINEKDINLDVAKRVQAILANKGVIVDMVREKDEAVSLQDRTIFTAKCSPDIFVSIHVNSSVRPEITGIETHYYHQESLDLAQTVHSSLASYIKSKDRGLFKSKFYVINHTEVPAILVEIGFISNDGERAELVSEARKQATAKSISEGILKYLNKK